MDNLEFFLILLWLSLAWREGYDVCPLLQEAAGKGAELINFLRAVRYAALRRQVLGGPPLTRETVAQTLGAHQVSGHTCC